jgi:hypothetical protein
LLLSIVSFVSTALGLEASIGKGADLPVFLVLARLFYPSKNRKWKNLKQQFAI